jgi:hypothetical protein
MKYISYYDIMPGSFPLFQAVDGIKPEVILEDTKWNQPRVFSIHSPSIICVPTWNWEFDRFTDLPIFLHQKMERDGYYTITGRRCDQEKECSYLVQRHIYYSCFGLAYSPEPWIKHIHHWTTLEQDSKLPLWLTGWNPKIFDINQIKL